MAVTFPGGTELSCSPVHAIHEFTLFEGDDGRKNVQEMGDVGLEQINELISNPLIQLDVVDCSGAPQVYSCPLNVTAGGDQSMQGSLLCMTYCNSCNPCPLCEVSSADMCVTDLERVKAFQARTQERIELHAHARRGLCPGCDKNIEAVAKEGEKEPKVKGDSWTKVHKGVVYGASFLIQLPISKWIMCILHANLTQTAALWERTLRSNIGTFCNKEYTLQSTYFLSLIVDFLYLFS
jgi:hypothetical protein